jgi:hypothetical protein
MREIMPDGNLRFDFFKEITEITASTIKKITKVDYDYLIGLVNSYDCDFYTFFTDDLDIEYSLKVQIYEKPNFLFIKTSYMGLTTRENAASKKADKRSVVHFLERYLKDLIV